MLLFIILCFLCKINAQSFQAHISLTGVEGEMSDDSTEGYSYYLEWGTSTTSLTNKIDTTGVKYTASSYNAVVHEAILTGLTDDTVYYYRITGVDDSRVSSIFNFKYYSTASDEDFSFLSLADGDGSDFELILNFLANYRKDSHTLTVFPGDMAFSNPGGEVRWDELGEKSEVLHAYHPIIYTVGNHEDTYNFISAKSRLTNKLADNSDSTNPLYYSFNFRNIHFVGLSNYESHGSTTDPEVAWLEADLAAVDRKVTPIIIAYYHAPMYTSSDYHGPDTSWLSTIEPIFHKYSVALTLTGHNHHYERSCAVYDDVCNVPNTPVQNTEYWLRNHTVHVTVGTAGRGPSTSWKDPLYEPHVVHFDNGHGYLKLDSQIRPPKLSGSLYHVTDSTSETLMDQWTIEFLFFCDGKSSKDSGQCNGNGYCVMDETCSCDTEFEGTYCGTKKSSGDDDDDGKGSSFPLSYVIYGGIGVAAFIGVILLIICIVVVVIVFVLAVKSLKGGSREKYYKGESSSEEEMEERPPVGRKNRKEDQVSLFPSKKLIIFSNSLGGGSGQRGKTYGGNGRNRKVPMFPGSGGGGGGRGKTYAGGGGGYNKGKMKYGNKDKDEFSNGSVPSYLLKKQKFGGKKNLFNKKAKQPIRRPNQAFRGRKPPPRRY